MENQNVLEPKDDTKKDNRKIVWIIGGICAAVAIAILVLIKVNVPEFALKTLIILVAIVVVVYGSVGVLFSFWRRKFVEPLNRNDIPAAKPTFQLFDQALEMLGRREYMFRPKRIIENGIETYGGDAGKFDIFSYVVQTHKGTYWAMLINAHKPEKYRILHSKEPFNSSQLTVAKQRLAQPYSPADKEVTEMFNPLTGTHTKATKVTHHKREKKKEDAQQGTLS